MKIKAYIYFAWFFVTPSCKQHPHAVFCSAVQFSVPFPALNVFSCLDSVALSHIYPTSKIAALFITTHLITGPVEYLDSNCRFFIEDT